MDVADRFRPSVNGEVLQRRMAVTEELRVPQVDGMHTHITQKFPLLDARGSPMPSAASPSTSPSARREEAQQAALSRRPAELGTSLDSETTLRVAELTVPRLADV